MIFDNTATNFIYHDVAATREGTIVSILYRCRWVSCDVSAPTLLILLVPIICISSHSVHTSPALSLSPRPTLLSTRTPPDSRTPDGRGVSVRQTHRGVIPCHLLYSQLLERVSAQLSHPSAEELEQEEVAAQMASLKHRLAEGTLVA